MLETEYGKTHIPIIKEDAPSFTAVTTQGQINFPDDYKGKWVVLFSHPADFTPVCTTEFMTFASMQEEFRKINTELIGLSIDSIFSHIAWLKRMEENLEEIRHGSAKRFKSPDCENNICYRSRVKNQSNNLLSCAKRKEYTGNQKAYQFDERGKGKA